MFWKLDPFLISLQQPHVWQNFGSWNDEPGVTPIDAIFAFFDHIEWTIAEKLPVWWKWCFGYRKRYLRTTYPEKMSHRALAVHEICPPRFFENFEWSKKFFLKKFFFVSESFNSQKKTCFERFLRFWHFFITELSRLRHLLTKKWSFWFWPVLAIFSSLVIQFDIVMQNKTVDMGFDNFYTYWQPSICEIKHFWSYFKVW